MVAARTLAEFGTARGVNDDLVACFDRQADRVKIINLCAVAELNITDGDKLLLGGIVGIIFHSSSL